MDIHIERGGAVPIYLQICRQIRELIGSGQLPAGFRLPPERRLAAGLGVNRSTILAAYRELKGDGLVDGQVGRGTVVLPRPGRREVGPAETFSWKELLRQTARRSQDPLLRDLLALTERPDTVTLSIGLPAPELLPVDTIRAILDRILVEAGPAALSHCPTEGHSPLRESISQLIASRGILGSPAEVLVVSGSQQGLDLAARALVDPGETVVVEEPSFFGALEVFRAAQARLIGVPVDERGMRTDLLEPLLERHRPRLIYTLPTFQNPSGVVMDLERRRHLLELAVRYQVPVLEDDPYSDLRYDGEPVPPLAALDRSGCVIYLSTFSKVLFPGLRLGFMVAPRPVLRRFTLAKQALDLHSNTLGQWALDRLLRDGLYQPHVRTLRVAYRERRDVMVEALGGGVASGLSFRVPSGGYYLWCRLPVGTRQAQLLARAAELGVSFLPGGACFVDEPGEEHARLNFTFCQPEQIREGVARWLAAVEGARSESRPGENNLSATRPLV